MDKSRKQFEEYCRAKELPLEVFNGNYNWNSTRIAWEAWQASRESLEVELPQSIPVDDEEASYEEGLSEGYNNAIDDFKQILISNGVKVK